MKKIILIFTFIFTFLFLMNLAGFAQVNMLNSLDLSKQGENYKITLNSSGILKYTKKSQGDNQIYIELGNTSLNPDFKVNYKDVKNFNNITVRQISNSKIRLYLKGEGIYGAIIEVASDNKAVMPKMGFNLLEFAKNNLIGIACILTVLASLFFVKTASTEIKFEEEDEYEFIPKFLNNNLFVGGTYKNMTSPHKVMRLNVQNSKESVANRKRA